MKLTRCLIKRQLSVFCIIFLFFTTGLYSQNWRKEENKNKWGDITGYSYMQDASGTINQNKDIPIIIIYVASSGEIKEQNMFLIVSQTIGDLNFNPASGFIDEVVTLSLRKDGITKSYKGTTYAAKGTYNQAWIAFIDADLTNTLKGVGQWDVLIEGRNWYIRSTIKGGLPSK